MKQVLLVEFMEKAFLNNMDEKIKEGYKVIAGSTVIKSVPTVITSENNVLNDIEHVFTVAVTGKYDYFIYSKNLATFRQEINDKLIMDEYNLVVGSLSIDHTKLDRYKECDRVYVTYYCCALYKE